MKIYSKVESDKLICSINSLSEIDSYRKEMSPETEYLQCSARSLKIDTYVKAHKHKTIHRTSDITQEAWVVISGRIISNIYDIDNSLIQQITIESGGCLILYRGGHDLLCVDDNTIFYEIKTGPYYGYESDKEDI